MLVLRTILIIPAPVTLVTKLVFLQLLGTLKPVFVLEQTVDVLLPRPLVLILLLPKDGPSVLLSAVMMVSLALVLPVLILVIPEVVP